MKNSRKILLCLGLIAAAGLLASLVQQRHRERLCHSNPGALTPDDLIRAAKYRCENYDKVSDEITSRRSGEMDIALQQSFRNVVPKDSSEGNLMCWNAMWKKQRIPGIDTQLILHLLVRRTLQLESAAEKNFSFFYSLLESPHAAVRYSIAEIVTSDAFLKPERASSLERALSLLLEDECPEVAVRALQNFRRITDEQLLIRFVLPQVKNHRTAIRYEAAGILMSQEFIFLPENETLLLETLPLLQDSSVAETVLFWICMNKQPLMSSKYLDKFLPVVDQLIQKTTNETDKETIARRYYDFYERLRGVKESTTDLEQLSRVEHLIQKIENRDNWKPLLKALNR